MATLGSLLILSALVLASGAFAASIAGARRGRRSLIDGGIGLFHAVTAIMLVLSAIIINAFVIGDFNIKYVQRYSDSAQPMFYKLASYWGGLDGSLMFWVTLLAIFGSVAIARDIGLNHHTIGRWKRDPSFVAELERLLDLVEAQEERQPERRLTRHDRSPTLIRHFVNSEPALRHSCEPSRTR